MQLRDYWVDELRWKSVGVAVECPEASGDLLPTVKVQAYQANESDSYIVTLSVVLTENRARQAGAPYQFRLAMAGSFFFLEGTTEEVQRRMIHVNGSSVLYGIARGIVAEATSHGQAGKYILPSINLLELLDRRGQLVGTAKPDLR